MNTPLPLFHRLVVMLEKLNKQPRAITLRGAASERQANAVKPRATAAAMGTPPTPHRVDGEKSAIGMTVAVLGWSKSRTMSGLKLVSVDCGAVPARPTGPDIMAASPSLTRSGRRPTPHTQRVHPGGPISAEC